MNKCLDALTEKEAELEKLECIKPIFEKADTDFKLLEYEKDGEYGELYCSYIKYIKDKELYSTWLSKKIKLQNDICFIKKKMRLEKYQVSKMSVFKQLKLDPITINTSSEIEINIMKWYENIPIENRSSLLKQIIISGFEKINFENFNY